MTDFFLEKIRKNLYDNSIDTLKVLIEIPEGTYTKYELMDGIIHIDRFISIPYPCSYGFIPDTLEQDGDALDIFVINPYRKNLVLKQYNTLNVKPIALIYLTDGGLQDNKIISVPYFSDDLLKEINEQKIKYYIDLIKLFLDNYKKPKTIVIKEIIYDQIEIEKIIKHGYNNKK